MPLNRPELSQEAPSLERLEQWADYDQAGACRYLKILNDRGGRGDAVLRADRRNVGCEFSFSVSVDVT